MSKSFRSIASIVLMIVLIPFLTLPAAANTHPWQGKGKVRPGFMAGGESHSDYFVDILLPITGKDDWLFFFNGNLRIDDNDGDEENIGFGYRVISPNDTYILGINAYFDTMKSEYGKRYRQYGFGAEFLSKWIDMRANYYNPTGTTENMVESDANFAAGGIYQFEDTALWFTPGGTAVFEEALGGYDGEVGLLLPQFYEYLENRAFIGGYKYKSELSDMWINGIKARLEARLSDTVVFNLENWSDDVRGSDTYFGAYVEFPFSFEKLTQGKNPLSFAFNKGPRELRERMVQRVERDRHIQSRSVKRDNSGGGGSRAKVADIIYVNQDNNVTGEGTYTNPYKDINDASGDARYADGTWVHVFSWDDVVDTYYDVSLTLNDNQKLWGDSFQFFGLSGTHDSPILDGGPEDIGPTTTSGNIVTLADNNEIMGLAFQNATRGVYGNGQISNSSVHDNSFTNMAGGGTGGDSAIHVESVFNPIDAFTGTITHNIFNNDISDDGGDGIYVSNSITSPSVTDATVTNNIYDNTIDNVQSGIVVTNTVGSLFGGGSATIDNVNIVNNITGNTISTTADEGIGVTSSIMAWNGIAGSSIDATINNSNISYDVSGNNISGTDEEGIIIGGLGFEGPFGAITAISIAADQDPVDGSVLASVTDSGVTAVVANNTITGSGGSGVLVMNNGLAALAIADSTDIAGGDLPIGADAGRSGVSALVDPSDVSHTFTNNVITDSWDSGIEMVFNNVMAWAVTGDNEVGNDSVLGSGNVSAEILETGITNTFTGNTITGNSRSFNPCVSADDSAGVFISESGLLAVANAGDLFGLGEFGGFGGSALVNDDITATVDPSRVRNTFTSNTISENSNDGVKIGMPLDDFLGGEGFFLGMAAGVNGGMALASSDASYVGGNVASLVEDTTIANTFTSNTISDNSGEGVQIGDDGSFITDEIYTPGNLLGAVSLASNESLVEGNVEAEVRRSGEFGNSSITNTFTTNIFNANAMDGIRIESSVAQAGALVGPFEDLGIGAAEVVYGAGTRVDGNVTADVTDTDVTNTFTGNTVYGASEGQNGSSGIALYESGIGASAEVFEGASTGGNVSATVDPSTVSNAFTNNVVAMHGYDGIFIEDNFIWAEAYVDNYDPYYGSLEVTETVSGNVTSEVLNSSISNTFTGNTTNFEDIGNGETGIRIGYEGCECDVPLGNTLFAGSFVYDDAIIGGNVKATIDPSGITNTFTSNSVSLSGDEGIALEQSNVVVDIEVGNSFVGGDDGVIAEILDTSIVTTFTTNTVSNNFDNGINVEDENLLAEVDVNNSRVLANVAGIIDPSSISNTFTNNTVNDNDGDNLDIDDFFATVDVTVNNSTIGSEVEPVFVIGSVTPGSVSAIIEDTTITNTFTGNEATGAGDLEDFSTYGAGIELQESALYAQAYVTSSSVAGDVEAVIDPSGITNTLTGNNVSDNEEEGILIGDDSEDAASAMTSAYVDGSSVGGDLISEVLDTSITTTVSNNTANDAVDDASIEVYDQYLYAYAGANASDIIGNVEAFVGLDDLIAPAAVGAGNSSVTTTANNNQASGADDSGMELGENHAMAMVDIYDTIVGDEGTVSNVSANVNDTDVSTTANNNTVSDNGWAGIEFTSGAGIYVSTNISDGSLVTGDATSGIDPSSASITANSNTGFDNAKDGLDLSDTIGAYATTTVNTSSTVTGSSTAKIIDVAISGTVSNNTFSGGGDDNIDFSSGLEIDATVNVANATVGGGEAGGTASALVTNSSIDHIITDNSVDTTADESIEIDGGRMDAYANIDSSFVYGEVNAIIDPSTNDITITGNDADNAGDHGIFIDNDHRIKAYADVNDSDVRERGTYSGDITARVEDGSITANINNNSINNAGDEGIEFSDSIFQLKSYTNTNYSNVDGTITSEVVSPDAIEVQAVGDTGSFIVANISNNQVDNAENDGLEFEDGLEVYAQSRTFGSNVSDINTQIKNTDAAINITDNTLANANGGEGILIDDFLRLYADSWVYSTQVEGSVLTQIDPSSVSLDITGNDISGNSSGGVDSGDIYAEANTEILFGTDVTGNVDTNVFDTDVSATINNNTIDGNSSDGVDLADLFIAAASIVAGSGTTVTGDVTSLVDPSSVDVTVDGNSINGNSGSGFDVNEVGAVSEVEITATADVGGSTRSEVLDTDVAVTLNNNTVTTNTGDGFAINLLGLSAETLVNGTSSTVGGSATTRVDPSSAGLSSSNNTVTGNGVRGLYLLEGGIFATAEVSGAVTGAVNSSVEDSTYTTDFLNDNYSTNNVGGLGGGGANYSTLIEASNSISGSAGSSSGTITGSTLTDTITGSTFSGNGGKGLSIYNTLDAETGAPGVTPSLFVEGSTFTNNGTAGSSDDGLNVFFDGDGTALNADLGGGTLLSTGGNSFFGNEGNDLDIDIGGNSKAEDNWWGPGTEATGPAPGQVEDNGDAVDTDPFLAVAP